MADAYPSRTSRIIRWIDYRLPFVATMQHELYEYPTPRNLTYWWNFGSLAGIMLVVMIVTGIVLAMQYTPSSELAFDSVQRIMRDVNYGWLIRYAHANGASMFFAIVYIHIFRGLYYGSYKNPRELLWILGVIILLLMIATAFMGYVLPWGQMSYWAATVITNLFSAIPLVGQSIVTFLWGGFTVGDPTLHRFYALHYLLPFIIVGGRLSASGGTTPLRLQQSARDRPQGAAGHDPVPSLLHYQGFLRSYRVSADLCLLRVLRAQFSRQPGQLSSRPTRCKLRTTSSRNGTSCPITRSCGRSPSIS